MITVIITSILGAIVAATSVLLVSLSLGLSGPVACILSGVTLVVMTVTLFHANRKALHRARKQQRRLARRMADLERQRLRRLRRK